MAQWEIRCLTCDTTVLGHVRTRGDALPTPLQLAVGTCDACAEQRAAEEREIADGKREERTDEIRMREATVRTSQGLPPENPRRARASVEKELAQRKLEQIVGRKQALDEQMDLVTVPRREELQELVALAQEAGIVDGGGRR